jgi:hypothetical protein
MLPPEVVENAVTVGELRDILADFPADALVILASNADGDVYTPLELVEGGEYDASSEIHGDFTATDDEENSVCLFPFSSY